jgi:iron complex outermembrane receptor protein
VRAVRALFLLLAPVLSASAETQSWRLVDAVGEPVRGATVRVAGGGASTVTNDAGQFSLDPEPEPPFDLEVIGPHGAVIGHVRVERRGGRVLVLLAEAEHVTVRGSPLPATSPSPAAAAAKLSRDTLESDRPVLLSDAIEELPGTSNAGGGHTGVPSLRGMARGRTLLLLDDARVTSERRAGPSAGFLDPAALDSIEIVRGPGSLAYGPDGLGGVIHARTPEPRPGAASGRAAATAASADGSAGLLVEQNVPVGRGAFLVQAHARRFDDYESPDGEVPNSASRDRGILLRGLLPAGSARLSLGLQSDRAFDVGRAAREGLAERTFYPEERSDRLTLSADLPGLAGADVFEVRAFVGRYRLVTARESLPAAGARVERAEVDAKDASIKLVGSRRLSGTTLRFGVDGHSRFGLEAPGSIEDARRVGGGVFVEGERAFASDRIHAVAGVRGDAVESVNRGGFYGDRDTSSSALSGLVAVTLRPAADSAASATLQYVRGFREPTLSDRFFRGVSGRGFVVGNPDLRSERSDQFDLALRTAPSERVRVALYGYVYRVRDLVERYRSGADFRFRNRGEQGVAGAELEADWSPSNGLDLSAALSWARGRIRDDDSFAADVPAPFAVLTARHAVSDRAWWRLKARLVAKDDEAGPTEVETPSFAVLDFAAGVAVTKRLEAILLAANLTDERYPLSPDEDAPPAPGRGFGLTLQARW